MFSVQSLVYIFLLMHQCFFPIVSQLQQQQNRLMKINHDLRHKMSVVEAQGKALIEQKVELEASGQTRQQELVALRQEVARLRERLQGNKETGPVQEELPQEPVAQVAQVMNDRVQDFYANKCILYVCLCYKMSLYL